MSDEYVDKIIDAQKFIPETKKDPFKTTENNGNMRASIDLNCAQYNVRMNIRQTIDDALDFSVLLVYTDQHNHSYILRRYNGDHGKHIDPLTGEKVWGPHIHKITVECQRTIHKDEGHAESTDCYKTLSQAIDVFMKDMNIHYSDRTDHTKLSDFEPFR